MTAPSKLLAPVESFKTLSECAASGWTINQKMPGLRMIPTSEMELGTEETLQVLRAIESLEDLDDVQNVYHNLRISEEALATLAEE